MYSGLYQKGLTFGGFIELSTQITSSIDVGYATTITELEVNEACLACANRFLLHDKVYRMHKENGITIQCNSLMCFRQQGGEIDEYQTNTIIHPKKSHTVKIDSKIIEPQNTSFRDRVKKKYHHIHEIERILLEEFGEAFKDEPAKLGMYMKMIDDGLKDKQVIKIP